MLTLKIKKEPKNKPCVLQKSLHIPSVLSGVDDGVCLSLGGDDA